MLDHTYIIFHISILLCFTVCFVVDICDIDDNVWFEAIALHYYIVEEIGI